MINKKEQTLGIVNTVSNEISDELYIQYMKEMLRESEEDIKNGNVMTIEESIERMKKKYEGFNIW